MEIFHSISALRKHLSPLRSSSKIALVPTMGALHQGHLELVRRALAETDVVVTSIFVNPTQFNNPEDLANYPSRNEEDLAMLSKRGNHIVFMPSRDEMYGSNSELKINFGTIEDALEGSFRPGHFSGVGQVISKLFNIVQPNVAFFGQKDIQQFYVIKKLVDELNFPVRLEMVQTKRESSGLAMSSRNLRLTETEKEEAALIFRVLKQARSRLLSGAKIEQIKSEIENLFEQSDFLQLEYFEIVQTDSFLPLTEVKDQHKTALCISVFCGEVRLIDNLPLIA